jgi:hypothetical protein
VVLPVTKITTLDVMLELSSAETTVGVAQLEWPQEVAGLLEVDSDGEDLVDQIFHADNAELAQVIFNKLVVGKSDALLINLAISALVDEFTDGLEVGVAIGDVRVDNGEHFLGSLGELDKDTVVDLKETEKLENLARFGSDLVDTVLISKKLNSKSKRNIPLDTEHEDELGLLVNEEAALLTAHTGESDLFSLSITVLLDILFGLFEDGATLLLVCLVGKWLAMVLQDCSGVTYDDKNIQPRKMVNESDNIDLNGLAATCGIYHHQDRLCLCLEVPTFFLSCMAEVRSALAFSWLFLFFNKVSGTRTWSCVGADLWKERQSVWSER